MPKTNSESDFGGSLTSDESDVDDMGPSSPISPTHPNGQGAQFPTGQVLHAGNLNSDTYINPSSMHPVSPTSAPPRSPLKSPRASLRSPRTSLHSPLRPNQDPSLTGPSPASTLTGAARFRATVRKVMQIQQTSSILGAFRGAGAEPGVDPRRASAYATYGHLKAKCAIQVVDYSAIRSKFQTFDNKGLIDFLGQNGGEKPPGVKVRWISIGGISWDVISALALTYDLHPLSLEDVVHRRGNVRSKADYFAKHLFIRILCHTLGNSDPDVFATSESITSGPRSASPTLLHSDTSSFDEKGNDPVYGNGLKEKPEGNRAGLFRRRSRDDKIRNLEEGPPGGRPPPIRSTTQITAETRASVAKLTRGQRINVLHRNLFMFLLPDGTLISIHQTPTTEFPEPILTRLRARDTVLRTTADPSLLLQSIIDLVVDRTVEVVEEYRKMILKLEHDILLKPKMKSVQHLHILSGDLTAHKLTMQPLKSLVYGLRRYDLDRCVAVAVSSAEDPLEPNTEARKVVGYMSHKSKVYLADVHDHVEYILASLEMFAGVAENLINYTFNMASYEMNEVMRRLTLATIIFLPLTLLTGYFGMNFATMPSVQNHSDALFWEIAIPVMVAVIPLFMWRDFVRVKHYFEKKIALDRTFR